MANTHLYIPFFILVPVGIYLLVKGVQLLLNFFRSAMLLRMPLQQQSAAFTVLKTGNYSIWQTGRSISKVPVQMPAPQIHNSTTGQPVAVRRHLSHVQVNNGTEGRIQLFYFYAPAGEYAIFLPENETLLAALMLEKKNKPAATYYLQIREQKPAYLLVGGVLLIIVAAFCTIAGFVLGVQGAVQG